MSLAPELQDTATEPRATLPEPMWPLWLFGAGIAILPELADLLAAPETPVWYLWRGLILWLVTLALYARRPTYGQPRRLYQRWGHWPAAIVGAVLVALFASGLHWALFRPRT